MEEEGAGSKLAWSWVIEALAKNELVGTTLLRELVLKAPPLVGYSGNEAKEAIALRCLEELLGPSNVASENHGVSDCLRTGFDSAETCEALLQRIWFKTSDSKNVSDELQRNVQSFVKNKKACLPRSTLELLKDAIVDENHPLAASLKECGGLDVSDHCVLNIPFDGGDPTSPPLRSDEDDQGDIPILAEENGCLPRCGVDDQLRQAYSQKGNSLSCRDDISSHHTDYHMQENEATSHDMDNQCLSRKRLKLDKEHGMQSVHQHLVPVGSKEMCNGAEDELCHEAIYGEDVEQSKTHVKSHDQPHFSPNKGGLHKEIDLTWKSSSFLRSECVFTENSPGMTESEPNLCMKCNKDGQLLSCSASSCPLFFHESCLGCRAIFDDQGNFYCPFCAYSRAISEYIKAKKKVSVAKKELFLFIGGRTDDQSEKDGDTLSGDDTSQGKYKNDKTAEIRKVANVVTQVAKPHQRSSKGKQLELSHSSAYMNFNGVVMATLQHLSFKDRQGADLSIQLSRDPSQIWNQGQDGHGSDGFKLSGDNNELKNYGKNTRCKITEFHEGFFSESIRDLDGVLQENWNEGTSTLLSPTPLRAIRGSPHGRRKKVRWTAEEEAILKEGVEKYDPGNGRAIPWKSILEYGGTVFCQGRTAIDLKDKWRNIMRGTSPKVK